MITAMPRIAIASEDFEGMVTTFRDQLGMPVIDISGDTVDSLGAHLAMCVPPGGSNIELMSPANPDAPLSQSLSRFLTRKGEGLFALMLEAPDPDAEAERLLGAGLNVLPLMAGAAGRDVHPNSTHGVLIRIYPNKSFDHKRDETELSLGLSGIEEVVIAVNNLGLAEETYLEALDLDGSMDAIGRLNIEPPSGGHIILDEIPDHREGLAALHLSCDNVKQLPQTLKARDIPFRLNQNEECELAVFGTHIVIRERRT